MNSNINEEDSSNIQDNSISKTNKYFNEKIENRDLIDNKNIELQNNNKESIDDNQSSKPYNDYFNNMANNRSRIGNVANNYNNFNNAKSNLEKAKQERDNSLKQVKNNKKVQDSSGKVPDTIEKSKNKFDKLKDNANVAKSKLGVASSALNTASAAKDVLDDPGESLKEYAKETIKDKAKKEGTVLAKKAGSAIIQFLKSNPYVLIVLGAVFFIIIIFTAFSTIYAEGTNTDYNITVDSTYDFNSVKVEVYSTFENDKLLDTVNFDKYVKGIAYYYLHDYINQFDMEKEEDKDKLMQILNTIFIVARSDKLSSGGYNFETNIGNEEPFSNYGGKDYCNYSTGCDLWLYNGESLLVDHGESVTNDDYILENAELSSTIDALDSKYTQLFNDCFSDSKYYLLVNDYKDEIFEGYDYNTPKIDDSFVEYVVSSANEGENIVQILSERKSFENYQLYNLALYASLEQRHSIGNASMWWPIGSKDPSETIVVDGKSIDIYGGIPTTSSLSGCSTCSPGVSSPFSAKDIAAHESGDGHTGIDIPEVYDGVIIAAVEGDVISVKAGDTDNGNHLNANKDCDENHPSGSGNHIIIDHDDLGIQTKYWHLKEVYVQVGEHVLQGQIIGTVGSTGCSSGPHLHFGVVDKATNDEVDPENYVSLDDPRP